MNSNLILNKRLNEIAIVIPVYEGNAQLKKSVKELLSTGFAFIIVVDDGSTLNKAENVLNGINNNRLTILNHDVNRGKGAALKTAFKHCLSKNHKINGVITMDGDGQHLIEDVFHIVAATINSTKSFIIGTRNFESENVPLRSRFGNILTRLIFKIATGISIKDTQSGLRYIPLEYLKPILKIKGNRYEFELNVLTELSNLKANIQECKISTTYINGNESSHFRPIVDSSRIYTVFLKYCFVSISSAFLDLALFATLIFFGNSIFYATYIARICSALYNFIGNRKFTFKATHGRHSLKVQIMLYVFVATISAFLSATTLSFLGTFSVTKLIFLKAFIDSCIFILNFTIQHYFIFNRKKIS
tara:strand:- start:3955 stop:5034 length:1080 start_codon:yes stop_codon:yes gene_type:complete